MVIVTGFGAAKRMARIKLAKKQASERVMKQRVQTIGFVHELRRHTVWVSQVRSSHEVQNKKKFRRSESLQETKWPVIVI